MAHGPCRHEEYLVEDRRGPLGSVRAEKLNIAGIFHAHHPEKGDTGGEVMASHSLTNRFLVWRIKKYSTTSSKFKAGWVERSG